MRVLLCYVFSSFCFVIVASGRRKLQVTMNGPVENCPNFENAKLILSDLMFVQKSSDDFALNGKFVIKETINGPINIRLTSKKYERGTWVNSMLNQNINDICTELAKENRDDWMKIFDEWTMNKKCPFVEKEGEYKDFVVFSSDKSPVVLPPNFYGKYKTQGQFYQNVNGNMVQFACYIVNFELASV